MVSLGDVGSADPTYKAQFFTFHFSRFLLHAPRWGAAKRCGLVAAKYPGAVANVHILHSQFIAIALSGGWNPPYSS